VLSCMYTITTCIQVDEPGFLNRLMCFIVMHIGADKLEQIPAR